MEPLSFFITLLSGILFGLSFSLVTITVLNNNKVQQERFTANIKLYRDILMKRDNKEHQYTYSTRQVINHVHTSILIHPKEGSPLPQSTFDASESKVAYFPNKKTKLVNM